MAFGLGESVGTAYVRIIADGTGLDASIRDEIDDAIDNAHLKSKGRDAGHDLSDGMSEGFKENITKGPGWKQAIENLRRSIVNSDTTKDYFKSPNWKAFVREAKEQFGDVGELAAKSMEEEFTRAGTLDGLAADQEKFYQRITELRIQAHKQIEAEEKVHLAELEKMLSAQSKRLIEIDNEVTAEYKFNLDERELHAREALQSAIFRSKEEIALLKARQKAAKDAEEAEEELRNNHPFRQFGREANQMGEVISRLFGKGSRNDFLNFVGGIAGAMPKALGAVSNLTAKLGELGGAFKTASEAAGGGAAGARAGFSVAIRALGSAGKGGPIGIAVGIGALTIAVKLMGSTMSLAAAAATALAGSLGTALVGGLGLAAAAFIPFAAGLGAAAIGFFNLSDAQKAALGNDLQPLVAAWEDLGQIAANNIFAGLGSDLADLASVVAYMGPAMDSASQAVRDSIGAWADLATSGGFNSFFDTLARDLPAQIESLNGIFMNLTTTVTGFFNGVSPVVSDFLDVIQDVTGEFSDWLNSVKGQKAVESYFSDALEALKAVGGAAVDAGVLIGNLFRAGANYGGNELFGDFGDKLQEWSAYLTDPANQAAIEDWVSDGAEFARVVGRMVEGIGKFIAALDTPFMRSTILLIFDGIATGVDAVAASIEALNDANSFAQEWLTPWGLFQKGSDAAAGAVQGLGEKLGLVSEKVENVGSNAQPFAKTFDNITSSVTGAADQIQKYGKRIGEAAGATSKYSGVSKEAQEQADRTAEKFGGLQDSVNDVKKSMNQWIRDMAKAARDMTEFGNNARDAAKKGLDEGLIKSLADLGPEGALRMKQLADASEKEIKRANKAFLSQEQATEDLAADLDYAADKADRLAASIAALKDKKITIELKTIRTGNKLNAMEVETGGMARGGVVMGPTRRLIGEAGPEAIVPLNRPLSQVDPSVRDLSAFAQGATNRTLTVSAKTQPHTVIEQGAITVITPASDARAVAWETLNYITASGY